LVKSNEVKHLERLSKGRDGQFYQTMLKQGTQPDKISALASIIQQAPESSLSSLMQLCGLAKKSNKKVAELAITALKNLFIQGHLMGD
jgi:hypothetical protein